jgi:hypothetical protein
VTEPAARAHVDGRNNIIVQAIGSGINVSVDPRIPHLRLTHFEARTKRASADSSDAALLSAYRTDVVPLLGRDDAIEDLLMATVDAILEAAEKTGALDEDALAEFPSGLAERLRAAWAAARAGAGKGNPGS